MSLTWNPLWVNPFESAWSIVEKIKYANAITSRDFVSEFGTRNAKGMLINQRNGLLRFNGIDLGYLTQCTDATLNGHADYYLNKMTGMFAHLDTNLLMRKEFTYCEELINLSFNSSGIFSSVSPQVILGK